MIHSDITLNVECQINLEFYFKRIMLQHYMIITSSLLSLSKRFTRAGGGNGTVSEAYQVSGYYSGRRSYGHHGGGMGWHAAITFHVSRRMKGGRRQQYVYRWWLHCFSDVQFTICSAFL